MIKIKKGNLNYDQSGRAYPDNPELKENWDCIWEHDDKYYELVGDNEHKEWEEVNIYDRIIDDVYKNYAKSHTTFRDGFAFVVPMAHSKESFIEVIKTDDEFSEKWGLKIEERGLSTQERNKWSWDNWGITCEMESVLDEQEVPKRAITLTYNNEKIEIYE